MKRTWKWALLAVALALALPAPGQKASDIYRSLKYDKAAEATITGQVTEVQDFECPVSAAMGNHVVVRTTEGAPMVVHIAPVKFMRDYGLELGKGDNLVLVGSKLKDSLGRETLIAREAVKENQRFFFRDKNGKPLW